MVLLKRKLKNGMSVIFEPRDLPVVSASISNKFGASFETSEHKGVAHFIEHLTFKGTTKRSANAISKEIENHGGIINAFTAHEVTSFWFKLPSKHIFTGFDILQDILNNSTFEPVSFEKEKKVVIEEIKMYRDNPSRHVYDLLFENLYGKPFGEGVSGNEKTIASLKRDFVAEYFKKNYAANQFIAVVVGNANFDKICAFLEKNFKSKIAPTNPQPIIWKHAHTKEERGGLDQAHFVLGMHAPFVGHKDYYALEVLDAYLANGMSSRLFQRIREELGLAYIINSSINAEQNYSYYCIYVGTQKESVDKVRRIILDEFAAIKNMRERDLEQAKERLIGLRNISSEESDKVMNDLLFAELLGDVREYHRYESKVKAVTLGQVKKLSKELVKEYSTAVVQPK